MVEVKPVKQLNKFVTFSKTGFYTPCWFNMKTTRYVKYKRCASGQEALYYYKLRRMGLKSFKYKV